MATNVYITASVDVDIKYQNDPSVTWTVLTAAAAAYDFSNKTDSDLNIYDYESGTLVKNYGESATEGLSYVSNAVTWNAAWDGTLEMGRSYYYELTYEDSGTTNPTVKVVDGTLTVE